MLKLIVGVDETLAKIVIRPIEPLKNNLGGISLFTDFLNFVLLGENGLAEFGNIPSLV